MTALTTAALPDAVTTPALTAPVPVAGTPLQSEAELPEYWTGVLPTGETLEHRRFDTFMQDGLFYRYERVHSGNRTRMTVARYRVLPTGDAARFDLEFADRVPYDGVL